MRLSSQGIVCCRPRLSENLVEFLPHFVGIGPVYGRGRILVEQVSLPVLE
jgi:hypothetical protein